MKINIRIKPNSKKGPLFEKVGAGCILMAVVNTIGKNATNCIPTARKSSKHVVAGIIQILVELDDDMKIYHADSWILIERDFMKMANIV